MEKDNQNLQELLAAIKKNVPAQPDDSFGLSMPQASNSNTSTGMQVPSSSLLTHQIPAGGQNPFNQNYSQLVDLLRNSPSSAAATANPTQPRVQTFPTAATDLLNTSKLLAAAQHQQQRVTSGIRKPPIPNPVTSRQQQQQQQQPQQQKQHGDVTSQQLSLSSVIPKPLTSDSKSQKSAVEITSGLTRALVNNPAQLNTLPSRSLPPGTKQTQSFSSPTPSKSSSQARLPPNSRPQQINPLALQAQSRPVSRQQRRTPSSTAVSAASAPGGMATPGTVSGAMSSNGVNYSLTQQSENALPNSSNRSRNSSRPITQEQVIVGHFCRHSLKLLARVMKNNPRSTQAEERLKAHIKRVWAQWVREEISRPQLLESVATFVRATGPETASLDVVRDFKVWYEREFEMQCQRNALANATSGQPQPIAGQNASGARQLQQVQMQLQNASSNQTVVASAGLLSQTASSGAVLNSSSKPDEKAPTPTKPQQVPAGLGKPEDAVVGIVGNAVKNEARLQTPFDSVLMNEAGTKPAMRGRGSGRGTGRATKVVAGTKRAQGVNQMKAPSSAKAEQITAAVTSIGLPQPAQVVKPVTPSNAPAPSASPTPQIDLTSAANTNKLPASKGLNMMAAMKAATSSGNSVGVVHIDPTDLRPGTVDSIPVVSKAGEVGIKGPSNVGVASSSIPTNSIPTEAKAIPIEGNQAVGLAYQSSDKPTVAISKGKQGPKPPPARVPTIESPTRSRVNVPGSPADSGVASSVTGTVSVGDKRSLDTSGVTSSSPGAKKPKSAKAPKPSAKKKASAAPAGPGLSKTARPPPARPENMKKGPGTKTLPPHAAVAGPVNNTKGAAATGVASQSGVQSGAPTATPNVPVKRGQGADAELSVTTGVVDIEEEENRLATRDDENEVIVVEENICSENMLLAGGKLRSKMQGIVKRFLLGENLGSDILEMVSLAAEERLRLILQKLKDAAAIRTEAQKAEWDVIYEAESMYEKMEQAIEEENRLLISAAQARVRNENERKDPDSKKSNGESGTGDSKKESSGVGDAERKEKLAVEKKRKETSSQRDALTGLVDSFHRREKRRGSLQKGLAPLKPLGEIGSKGLGSLPPIPKKTGSESMGLSGSRSKGTAEALERLGPLGPLQKGGRKNSDSGQGAQEKVEKEPLTLSDVLFFLQDEVISRKSALYYKWSTRAGFEEE